MTIENRGEQAGRRAGNGLVGPLTLGLDAEMGPCLLEGNLDLPASDDPSTSSG